MKTFRVKRKSSETEETFQGEYAVSGPNGTEIRDGDATVVSISAKDLEYLEEEPEAPLA